MKILWHMPRKSKKVRPSTTFVGLIEDFTDRELHDPIKVPSCVGVLQVIYSRSPADLEAHGGERAVDYGDPVHRQVAGRLI